ALVAVREGRDAPAAVAEAGGGDGTAVADDELVAGAEGDDAAGAAVPGMRGEDAAGLDLDGAVVGDAEDLGDAARAHGEVGVGRPGDLLVVEWEGVGGGGELDRLGGGGAAAGGGDRLAVDVEGGGVVGGQVEAVDAGGEGEGGGPADREVVGGEASGAAGA